MLLLAQAQLQPVCSSICHSSAWRFVGHHQVLLPRCLLGVASVTLYFSLLFFHPSFHFTFFWAHQPCRETSNRALSCGWDLFTIQTLTICLCLLLPSLPLLTTTDLNALWDLTRKWNNMAATATMDAIILLFSLPVFISLPSASISENEITEWK